MIIELDWLLLPAPFASLFELNNMLIEGMRSGCLADPEKDPITFEMPH